MYENMPLSNEGQSSKKTFFVRYLDFQQKEYPNYVFAEFCHDMMQEFEQMLVFSWILII